MSPEQTLGNIKQCPFQEENSHVWIQKLTVGFWALRGVHDISHLGQTRQPGTTTQVTLPIRGCFSLSLIVVSGASAAAYQLSNPIRATLSCLCCNHAPIARHKIFLHLAKPSHPREAVPDLLRLPRLFFRRDPTS